MANKKQREERQRGKRRDDRHSRRQQQHSGGGEWDCITIPEGITAFKPEADKTYHIDVIPYVVGEYNRNADPGDEYFELSYPVYNDLGVDAKKFVAIGELLNERDPVAEHFANLRKQGAEWDDMKGFKPKWRQIMLFFVHEQADKGLQLFEGAYGTFGELLDEEIRATEEDYVDNFDDPDAGATLVVRFKEQSIGKGKPWIRASKINFTEREDGFDADGDAKLAAKVLDQAASVCLDELLKIPTYETLKDALDGVPTTKDREDSDTDKTGDPEEDTKGRRKRKPKPEPEPEPEEDEEPPFEDEEPEEEPKPKKGKKKTVTAEDLGIEKGNTVEHDEYGTCIVLRITAGGTQVSIKDENGDIHTGVDPVDLEPVDEDEEPEEEPEEKPKKSKTKKAKEPEPEENEDEEEPKPKKGKAKAKASKDEDDWDDDW